MKRMSQTKLNQVLHYIADNPGPTLREIMRVYPDPNAPEDIVWECMNCDCEGE